MIFSILSSESPWTSEGRKWIKVTHVCRKWRQISLASSILWTYVDTKWGKMATEFIARSGDSPLKLKIRIRDSASLPEIMAVNLAFAHFSRACELHIHVHRVDQLLEISRSLKLHDPSTHLETISLHSQSKAQFPHHFFWTFNSTIRRLETSGVCLPSNFEMFRQLTQLKVNFEMLPQVPPNGVFNVLNNCSKLVDIEFCTFEWIHEPLDTARIIALPFLQRICFARSSSTCIHLLDQLIFPPAVSLIIKDSRFSGLPFPPIPSDLCSPPYDTCVLNIFNNVNVTQIVASRVSFHDVQSRIDVHFSRLYYYGRMNVTLGLETLRSGFKALLPHLENLIIALALPPPLQRGKTSWSVAEIAALLVSMPNLGTLTLQDFSFKPNCNELAENLLGALYGEQPVVSAQERVPLICPNLQTFIFINFKFPLLPSADDKYLQKSLLACALHRSKHGAKLMKVDISRCRHVSTTFVEELSRFVDHVIQPDAEESIDDISQIRVSSHRLPWSPPPSLRPEVPFLY
ncbi:hypothetical protein BD410DRAFT_832329 [Rickenella mellea]|uniref:F-box domain-containing protein n=1 Tax=Rickenella mellea TaxID=50990 RepID=A0A4Y7PKC7_9AGAM|nr:hypothetical protein BD410DRAFT_832329 [Rickenella mellea]